MDFGDVDLFEYEQMVYNDAIARIGACGDAGFNCGEEYKKITKEYGRLLKQLRRSTRIADRTTTDLYESNLVLNDKVHFDALTGIYNRRFLDENLTHVVESLSRTGGKLSVCMLDIDFFKKFNDTYGHQAGDVCLKSVAQEIAGCVPRDIDFAARYGGEEFVIILPGTDEDGARLVADKVLEHVRSRHIPHEKNDAADCVTVSIGITTGEVRFEQSGADYIERADAALYISKKGGRNRYTYINFKEA